MKPANTARFSIMSLPRSFTDEHNALMKAHASMNDYITSMKIMFPYKNMLDDVRFSLNGWNHAGIITICRIPH